jgi:hypothetical protein
MDKEVFDFSLRGGSCENNLLERSAAVSRIGKLEGTPTWVKIERFDDQK